MATLGNVTDTMSSLAVVGEEPIVMSSPHMSLILQKMRSDTEGEHTVGNGQVMVQFANFTEAIGGQLSDKDVDVQVTEDKNYLIFFLKIYFVKLLNFD